MNDINKILFEVSNNIPALADSALFKTDFLFNNLISTDYYWFYQTNFFGHPTYPFDFYLCMLCAGVTEDMIFSPPAGDSGIYDIVESMADVNIDTCERAIDGETWFDPSIAVYCGRYDFAEHLMNIRDNYNYSDLVEAECWDFIDKITDCGKNERHIEIVTDLFMKERFREEKGLFDYIARYSGDEPLTYNEAIDIALREINSAEALFYLIAQEVYSILDGDAPDVDRKKFNERAIDIMRRCAELGLTLDEFRSFSEILLPVYRKDVFTFCENVDCPCVLARLIGENTAVYGGYAIREDLTFNENELSSYGIPQTFCRFITRAEKNFIETAGELEYICKDFNERLGRRLTIKIECADDFFRIQLIPKELFDIHLCDDFLFELYEDTKALKKVLRINKDNNYEILSQKNIDEITAYFVSILNNSSGKEHSAALKKLNQLNNRLIEMGGKIK